MTAPLSSTSGQSDLPRWFASVFATVGRIETGSLTFVLPDGRAFRAAGAKDGPEGVIQVRRTDLFARMVREGEMGFAEGYMDGDWDSPDLQAVLDVALLNNENMARRFSGAALARMIERARHRLRDNTRKGSRKNIAAHYDLGNDFYSRWLDDSMTYSSALFHGSQESLETGQRNKYAAICDALDLPEGAQVLEIGCGWGGFAEYAAGERGLRVRALTISQAQHDFAVARIAKAGLSDKVEIVLQDYRDEKGEYDGIASIEMLEAVGERFWPSYFSTVRDCLKPGGRAAVQVILIQDRLFAGYRKGVDFVQKHIFPGGMLPSPEVMKRESGRVGLEVAGILDFGQGYSETLRRWRTRFHDAWDEIAPMGFDARFQRMWDFYLASCAACFMSGATDVAQYTLRRA